MDQPIKIFCSYSSRDTTYREQLETALHPLIDQGLIRFWYDRTIEPGEEWNAEIQGELEAADMVLLLLSPDFLESPHCKQETARALERKGKARVVPVRLRPTFLKGTLVQSLNYRYCAS